MCGFSLQGLVITFGLAAPYAPVDHTINVYFHVIRARPNAGAEAPNVLWPGDHAQVEAWAHHPEDAYAFASAEFQMAADLPGWTDVSDGIIAGGQVQEIAVGQAHNPAEGVFADPSNPIRIWSGIYTPDSSAPRLVQVQATPSAYSYYPSESTSSSVEGDAAPDRDWLLINPLTIGDALVAPGEGTTILGGHGRDVLLGGAGTDLQEIQFGFLAPDSPRVRMDPDTPPTNLALEVEVEEDPYKNFKFRIVFDSSPQASTYDVQPDWPSADAYEYKYFRPDAPPFYLKLDCIDGEATSMSADRVPDAISTRAQLNCAANQARVISRFDYDQPVRVVAPDGTELEAIAFEVRACRYSSSPLRLGTRVIHTVGTGTLQSSFFDDFVLTVPSCVAH